MIPSAVFLTDFRLFLHVLGATIWVGGQIVLAGLVPTIRKNYGVEGTRAAARAYNRIAWPAYGLIVVTGIWNVLAVPSGSIPLGIFSVKMLFVIISGVGALAHQLASRNKIVLAVGGAMASLGAVLALLWGVALGNLVFA